MEIREEELGMYTDRDHIKYSDDHIVNKKPYEVNKIQEDFDKQVENTPSDKFKLPIIGKIFPNMVKLEEIQEIINNAPNDQDLGKTFRAKYGK